MYETLPYDPEQVQLLDVFAELAQAHRAVGPILTPTPTHFPDPWTPDARGAQGLARRLLSWAGVADVEVDVVVDEPMHHAFAWLEQAEPGRCVFGVDARVLADAEHLTGALAHAVAHAWRTLRGLRLDDAEEEELWVDVTAVFLGFGVFSANAASLARSSGELAGATVRHHFSVTQVGVLPHQSHCFLLAAQVLSRGDDAGAVRALLGRNQAASFDAALQKLERDATPLDRLRVTVEPHRRALPAAGSVTVPEQALPVPSALRPVFAVRSHAGWVGFVLGLGSMFPVIWVLARYEQPLALLLPPFVMLAGRLWTSWVCSGTGCEGALDEGDATCSKCGGVVVGKLERLRDKHDAELEWRRQHVPDEVAAEEALHEELEREGRDA